MLASSAWATELPEGLCEPGQRILALETGRVSLLAVGPYVSGFRGDWGIERT